MQGKAICVRVDLILLPGSTLSQGPMSIYIRGEMAVVTSMTGCGAGTRRTLDS